MNKTLRYIITTSCIIFILWFIGYFLIGDFISLEFSNYEVSQLFPKILTFLAAVSIYVLFLLSIKKNEGWSFSNVMKFVLGIIVGLIPLFTFEYYSMNDCADWKIEKINKKTLYQSKSSTSETIKLVEIICEENKSKSLQVKRIMQITPLFITSSSIDTTKISTNSWKKL
ncbi:hypothetical protein [Algoriella sp.]|uniref:hypothetical protein n=1 Tax=Algoriella sp. TaxID=1872434 RepID=UPI002FC83825